MGLLRKTSDKKKMMPSPQIPIGIVKLVVIRVFCVMYILLSALLTHLAVMYRPWKIEWVKTPKWLFEISIWDVCRATAVGKKCYEGELDDAPDWFFAFRWMLMLAVFFQYFCLIFIIFKLIFTKNSASRLFWIPAFICLTSAIFIMIAMLILVGYRELEFLDESRMYRMGWRVEEPDVEESWAWPYYLMWVNFSICAIGFFVCMYTHVKDTRWAKNFEMRGRRNHASDDEVTLWED